jgi:hypothetical protein
LPPLLLRENIAVFVYGTTRKMFLLHRPSSILYGENTIGFFYGVFGKISLLHLPPSVSARETNTFFFYRNSKNKNTSPSAASFSRRKYYCLLYGISGENLLCRLSSFSTVAHCPRSGHYNYGVVLLVYYPIFSIALQSSGDFYYPLFSSLHSHLRELEKILKRAAMVPLLVI